MKTLLIAVGLLAAAPLHADTYRWVGADGTVHYGNVPPKASERAVVPGAMPPASNPNQDSLNQNLRAATEAEAKAQEESAAKPMVNEVDRAAACVQARQGLAALANVTANKLRVTQEQFDQRRAELQKAESDYCG